MMDQVQVGEEEVSNWIKKSKTIHSIARLPGDASTRKYYRIVAADQSTYIVMRMESFEDVEQGVPFLAVQKHLAQSGVDVPQVLDVDPGRGLILLEDLGDTTLLRRLQESADSDDERHLYERAIDALVQLQVNASIKNKAQPLDAFKLKFDHEKLMWEVQFTLENFYQLYLKRDLTEKDQKILVGGMSEICEFLAKQPTVLTHRDYHSRNIMIAPQKNTGERMVVIDFQDARMGPPQYDLASLLKDSYYQLEEAQISRLLDYYIVRIEALTEQSIHRDHFIQVFDLMAVQRNFKAIGSFASFLNRRGDASYLKYIGNTFENIRRTLLKYPQYSKLRETLFHYYYF